MTAIGNDHAADRPAAAAGTVGLSGDTEVARMGFGARWLPNAGPEGSRALLHRALELGVNLIDTADVYGDGLSEELLAAALHPYPPGLVIATKGGQVSVGGQPTPDCRPEHLRAACEASLRRLRMDAIPLYQLHQPDPQVPVAESVGVLADLQREGKIERIGVSNMRDGLLDQALATAPIVSLQNLYNLSHRHSDPEVDRCAKQGLAFMPWAPLAGTADAGPEEPLARVAAKHDASAAQVALAWMLARSPAMVVIPGTSSIEHLEHNVAAAALELSAEDLALLGAPD